MADDLLRDDETTPEETQEFQAMLAEAVEQPPEKPAPEVPAEKPAEKEAKPYQPKNEDESKALAHGWTPKEDWVAAGKDPEDWVSARRFNLDGKKLRQIQELETRLAETDRRTKSMLEHVQKTERAKYDAQLKAAEEAKWTALEQGDVTAARRAEEKVNELKAAPPAPPQEVDTAAHEALWGRVLEAHPDARALSTTPDFQAWLNTQSPVFQMAYIHSPDPRDGIEIFGRYKRDRGLDKPSSARATPAPMDSPRPAARGGVPRQASFNDLSAGARSTFREFVRVGMYEDTAEARAEFAKECALRGEL